MSRELPFRPDQIVQRFEALLAANTCRQFHDLAREIELMRYPGGGYVVNALNPAVGRRGVFHFDRYGEIRKVIGASRGVPPPEGEAEEVLYQIFSSTHLRSGTITTKGDGDGE